MGILPKKDDLYDLDEDELAFSQSEAVEPEIRELLAESSGSLGTEIGFYQKFYAWARVKGDASAVALEVHAHNRKIVDLSEANERIKALEQRNAAIEATYNSTVAEKDRQILQLTAAPAAVVHAEGRNGRDD